MNSKTLTALARLACGTVIIVTHMVTGVDGTFIIIGLGLLGIPIEVLQSAKAGEEEN